MEDFVNENQMKDLTDEKLFELCKHFGKNALLWRQKFAGLLPEVNKRQLYAKKGFNSIFEFAFKLAGLSEKQVRRVLNLERRFADKPVLQSLLVNGEVSVNKLAHVASMATTENQEELAMKVKILSKSAIETLARDEKMSRVNGLQKPLFGVTSVPGNRVELSDEAHEKLWQLQQKGIDVNKLILELLEKREQEISQKKETLSTEAEDTNSRYISVKIKHVLAEEYGTKCVVPTCKRKAEIIHHAARFALTGAHDPRFMAPLCKEHHAIAHSIDLKFLRKQKW